MPRLMADAKSAGAPRAGGITLTSESTLRKILIFLCVLALNATAIVPVLRNKGMLPDNSYAFTLLQQARLQVLDITGNAVHEAIAPNAGSSPDAAPTRQSGLSSRIADTTIWQYRAAGAPGATAGSSVSGTWRDRALAVVADSMSGPKASFKRSPHNGLVDEIDLARTAFTPIPAYESRPRWQRPAAALVDWRHSLAAASDKTFASRHSEASLATDAGEAAAPLAVASGQRTVDPPAKRLPGRH